MFLNACQVGAAQELLGNYGGIAQAFLQVGASAVIAPLWSIDDEIAQHIALEFYQQALAADKASVTAVGTEPGPDAAAERTVAPKRTGRPSPTCSAGRSSGLVQNAAAQSSTYLAYQFYGHPSLRLTWRGADANGGHRDG